MRALGLQPLDQRHLVVIRRICIVELERRDELERIPDQAPLGRRHAGSTGGTACGRALTATVQASSCPSQFKRTSPAAPDMPVRDRVPDSIRWISQYHYTENRSVPAARLCQPPISLCSCSDSAAAPLNSRRAKGHGRPRESASCRWPAAGPSLAWRATVTLRIFIRRWTCPQRWPRTDRSDRSDPQAKKLVLLWGKHPLGGGLATENGYYSGARL